MLRTDQRVVVLTGAGISAESGVPTFRDPQDGLWASYNPEDLATRSAFRRDPQLVLDWYDWRRSKVLSSEPNAAHLILADWQTKFKCFTLITQNVDGLHQRGGSKNVIEMHGSIHKMKCIENNHKLEHWIVTGTSIPTCEICGSHMRPDIVWFGENLASDSLRKIDLAIRTCDVFIAVGTSGIVYPAAGLLSEAKTRGALTININPDVNAQSIADVKLAAKASDGLRGLTIAN